MRYYVITVLRYDPSAIEGRISLYHWCHGVKDKLRKIR